MDYVVLARKLRPQRFQDLVGQQTTARALRNAVISGRVAHAYLFAGSRGVGKTSTARILAKALNCSAPADGEPCNTCENCREITANASPDVVEIDGASNRGIDSIRELRDNTRYAPAKCRFKTYIIDEVHMLTMESFNALLKTLEEPPPHIKFVLATTAPQRLPETIVSRCQRYDFARIPVGTMVDYLVAVTEAEQLTFSRNALEAIARGAAGGMRDALTAIDRVVSYAGAHPEEEQVFAALGLTDDRETLNLLAAVLEKDLQAALETFESLIAKGSDLNGMLAALLTDLKELSLFRTLKGEGSYFQDHTSAAKEFFAAQKDRASLDQLQQLFYLFLELERQLRLSEFGRACFEMALIKACRVEPLVGVSELLQQVKELKNAPAAGGPLLENEHRHEHRPPGRGRQRAREGGANVGAGPPSSPAGDSDSEADTAPPEPPERAAAPAQPGLPTAPPAAATAQPDPQPPPAAAETTVETTVERPTVEPTAVAQTAEGQSAGQQTAGQQSAEGQPAEGQSAEGQPAEEEPSLAESLPCEDGRWIAFIESLRGSKPKLAADLRRAEVAAIGENEVEIVPPPGAELLDGAEAGVVEESLRRAFGDAFHPRFNRDKNRKARPAYSLVARERQREGARLAAEREAATADPAVEGLLRLFPEGRVEHVQPSTANGSDDV